MSFHSAFKSPEKQGPGDPGSEDPVEEFLLGNELRWGSLLRVWLRRWVCVSLDG